MPVDAEAYPGIPEAKKNIEISDIRPGGKETILFRLLGISLYPVISGYCDTLRA
jgi:hypothetical protein